MQAGEFDLIARIRARADTRADVVLGIGDDAALLQPPPGRQLVVTADMLNVGVHFPEDTAAAAVGWKSLAVNLSDLAAMGAAPAWCMLSLSLPASDPDWLEGFLDGFLSLASRSGIVLVGGDTTRGPLSIAVTAMGFIEPGKALRRDGARVGDEVWVSGTPGDAAAALRLHPAAPAALRERLDRPSPRNALGLRLPGIASAAVDVSDGLLADLGHITRSSGAGAVIELEHLPVSEALRAAFDPPSRHDLQASGGDDYELCFTAAPEHHAAIDALARELDLPLACIGRIVEGEGVRARVDGQPWQAARTGYAHF